MFGAVFLVSLLMAFIRAAPGFGLWAGRGTFGGEILYRGRMGAAAISLLIGTLLALHL